MLKVYICQGRPEHLDELKQAAQKGGRYDWWPIKRSARPGNMVIFYLTSPISAFVASGTVDSETGPCPDQTSNFRNLPCAWIRDIRMLPNHVLRIEAVKHLPEWGFLRMPEGRAEVPSELVERFLHLLQVESPSQPRLPEASLKALPELPEMKQLLEQFRQIIVYGPPGTGKTRAAKRVALAMLTGKDADEDTSDDEIEQQLAPFRDPGRFDLVVFHPAYEYEQFVGGIEPEVVGQQVSFRAKAGPFLKLCRKAEAGDKPVVLVVDEINRGNLPKLLGELVYAPEYRGHSVTLPFECDGSADLVIPKNLYILATMNSADRSIGHIDVAIRRRFGLVPLVAQPKVVRQMWSKIGDGAYGEKLAGLMERVNGKFGDEHDPNAATEQGVGHSYFLPKQGSSGDDAKSHVAMKWEYQVQPLLREYAPLMNNNADFQEFFRSLDQCLK